MRVLITGVSGFAGRHLVDCCRLAGAEVVGVARSPIDGVLRERLADFHRLDLGDPEATVSVVRSTRPDRVFHLAAQASVGESWRASAQTIAANLSTTQHLLDAVRLEAPEARVLVACSAEEYGPVPGGLLPVTETALLRPQNPYAVSKAAVDLLAGFYADAHQLAVVRTRAFNHCGPGQADDYVVSAFAHQIAAAEAAGEPVLRVTTGNLLPRRDFTDVRDVVRAYWLAADLAEPGAYNVCCGRSTSVADILATLAAESPLAVDQHTDPARVRAHEVMEIRGSNRKLAQVTGWQPEIALEQTLHDTLEWWRGRVRVGAGR